jgi:hypothetical protein
MRGQSEKSAGKGKVETRPDDALEPLPKVVSISPPRGGGHGAFFTVSENGGKTLLVLSPFLIGFAAIPYWFCRHSLLVLRQSLTGFAAIHH